MGLFDKIKQLKADRTFKKAGQGHRLTDEEPSRPQAGSSGTPKSKPPVSTDDEQARAMRAAAAERRNAPKVTPETRGQWAIKQQALRELEAEQAQANEMFTGVGQMTVDETSGPTEVEHCKSIEGVSFTCDAVLPEIALPKYELIKLVEERLCDLATTGDFDEALHAAVMLLFSRNRAYGDELESAVATLKKCLTNITEREDEKYLRLNLTKLQDRTANVKFIREFLVAVGFAEKSHEDSSDVYMAIDGIRDEILGKVHTALEYLNSHTKADDICLKLHRNPAVYKIDTNQKLKLPYVPDEFYSLTAEEVRKFQAERTNEVDKLTTLRTQAMRDRDAVVGARKYKYTLIRIRFPNQFLLQGTFGAYEPIKQIRDFICGHLKSTFGSFNMKDAATGKVLDNDEKSLQELNLCPAALILFEWDKETLVEYARNNLKEGYLREELENDANQLPA
ncbi:hypothetical protein QR680_009844 [Steinernema hermaphroditum]|uniref:UBX domain-containing protein n=1 Tax=Steinernema hermaphroditum TaxID=289476 RepID=A0AA39IP87_9BILA|nr:hypothetical protein QR680_009844 [Steinernema hermaphroditum]